MKMLDVYVTGNNNADGKAKCSCKRNITVHFRRHINEKQKN